VGGSGASAAGVAAGLGSLCRVCPPFAGGGEGYLAEVSGLNGSAASLSFLERAPGVSPGWWVVPCRDGGMPVGDGVLGRVLDGMGRPLDGRPLSPGLPRRPVAGSGIPPLERPLICEPLATGVRAIDGLLTCGRGQRVGIFAGSGVGKSTLLGMIVRNTYADRCVVTLVGERGREVREFTDRVLGPEGMARAAVVVATADAPASARVRAVYASAAVAEEWRDRGLHVVWILDSVTRFAHALREVGLAAGEPPATRGYPPSVFSTLARVAERAGPAASGSITLFCTVLVEGDDLSEPVSDCMRSVLDGHVVLSRELAGRGQYPAVDVLASVSRLMPHVVSPEHLRAAQAFRDLLAAYRSVEDLVAVGAYVPGSNPRYDAALSRIEAMRRYLEQGVSERVPFEESVRKLGEVVSGCGT